jgi:hypothetical protein
MARITIIPDGTITLSCGSGHVVRVQGRRRSRDADDATDDRDHGNGEGGRGAPRGRGADDADDDGGGTSDGPIFVPPPILPFLAQKPPRELMHLSVLRVRSVDELRGMMADLAGAWGDHPARPRDLIVYLAQRAIDIPELTAICNQLPEDTGVTVVLTAGDA